MIALSLQQEQISYSNKKEIFFGKPFPSLFHNGQGGTVTYPNNGDTFTYSTGKVSSLYGLDFSGFLYTDSQYRATGGVAGSSIANSGFTFTPAGRKIAVPRLTIAPSTTNTQTKTNLTLQHREFLIESINSVTPDLVTINLLYNDYVYGYADWTAKTFSRAASTIDISIKSINPNTQTITTHGTKQITIPSVSATTTVSQVLRIDTDSLFSIPVSITTDFINGNLLYIEYSLNVPTNTIANTTTTGNTGDYIDYNFGLKFLDSNIFNNQIII